MYWNAGYLGDCDFGGTISQAANTFCINEPTASQVNGEVKDKNKPTQAAMIAALIT
jgi:hypothetical protein